MTKFKRSKFLLILALAAVLLLTSLSGCSGSITSDMDLKMHPAAQLPENVRQSPIEVRQAYQFAVANPDLVGAVPCYCGCAGVGHDSNYKCYVADVDQNGEILYDNHALYCTICVDITQDVMRLTAEGEAIEDIRTIIDETYSKFDPSN